MTLSQTQVLNRNKIKYILIVAMLIDHIAWAFVPTASILGQAMHFIGRLTGPSMSVLLAEGFQYTKNKKKYALRLFIFAMISWVPYSLNDFGTFPKITPGMFGMIFTLFLAFITIWMWADLKVPKAVKVIFVILLCALSFFGDWPFFAILWAFFAYIYRERPVAKWVSFGIIALADVGLTLLLPMALHAPWKEQLFQTGVILVPILLICFYNRKKGSSAKIHKWFFYIFYPLHILIIYLIKVFLVK